MDGSPEAVFKLGNNAPATESGSTTQVTVTTKDGSDMVTPGVVSDEDDAEPTINLSITEGNTVILEIAVTTTAPDVTLTIDGQTITPDEPTVRYRNTFLLCYMAVLNRTMFEFASTESFSGCK